MPVDRTLAEDLAQALVDLYGDAQTRLATDVARRLDSGWDLPNWADQKLQALFQLRRFAQTLVGRLDGALADEVAQTLILGYIRGGNEALGELARAQSTHPEWLRLAEVNSPNDRLRAMIARRESGIAAQLAQARRALPGADALNRLTFSLVSKLRGTHLRILRWDEDAYREVIAKGTASDVLLGLKTRRRASQVAWEKLLTQGITGFVDRSGRGWNLASYVEMATRTTVAQAAVEGHLDRLSAAGLDLVVVSNAPQECSKCRPWEGKILARSGPGGRRTVRIEHATRDGEFIEIEIAGSVDEAIAAGLMHPNCRHSLSAYLPGVTRIPTHTEDPDGDKARQKLRALERKVRREKLIAETALDPAAAKAAKAKVRATQAEIRDHVKTTGLIRQPSREQIDLGNRPPAGPTAQPTPPTPPPPPKKTAPASTPKPPAARTEVGRTELSGGKIAKVDLVEYDDGTKLVEKRMRSWSATDEHGQPYKVSAQDQADAEELGPQIMAAVGARGPQVRRLKTGQVEMEYMHGRSTEDYWDRIGKGAAEEERATRDYLDLIQSDQGKRLGLADVLMGNFDRHQGNWMVTDAGDIVGIDHGLSWSLTRYVDQAPRRPAGPASIGDHPDTHFADQFPRYGQWRDNDLTPADVQAVRERLTNLRGEFERLGRLDWLEYSMARLDIVGRYAKGTRNLIAGVVDAV